LDKYDLPLASNQVHYNLLNREIETNGVLETARELGVTIIAWSPLASGLLTGKFHKDPQVLTRTPLARRRRLSNQLKESQPVIDLLDEIARKHSALPAQVALSWLINREGNLVVAIPGATRSEQVRENAEVMNLELSDDDIFLLNEISAEFRGI
jgi:aryl-alcohol dehydrogenase-like predicted oxidoreductase